MIGNSFDSCPKRDLNREKRIIELIEKIEGQLDLIDDEKLVEVFKSEFKEINSLITTEGSINFQNDNKLKFYKKLIKIVDKMSHLEYYNIDLGESSLDHRRREEFPAIFIRSTNEGT